MSGGFNTEYYASYRFLFLEFIFGFRPCICTAGVVGGEKWMMVALDDFRVWGPVPREFQVTYEYGIEQREKDKYCEFF